MTTYKHIVQVHTVEKGLPILRKIEEEFEFDTKEEAEEFILECNKFNRTWLNESGKQQPVKAVYLGLVNKEMEELE